jgi:hypothetical protein
LIKRELPHDILSLKKNSRENTERILKPVEEKKKQIKYKGKSMKIAADFTMEKLKARRSRREVFQDLNENNFKPRILYPVRLSFKIDGVIKVFQNKQKINNI